MEKGERGSLAHVIFKRKAVLQDLSTLGVPDLDLDQDLDRLRRMLEDQLAVERLAEQAKSLPYWDGMDTNAAAVEQTTAAAAKLRLLVARAADSPAQTAALRSALQLLLSETADELTDGSPLHQRALEYSRTYCLFFNALTEFERLADSPETGSSPDLLTAASHDSAALIGNIAGLNRWTAWLRVRKEALSLGLELLVVALGQGILSPRRHTGDLRIGLCALVGGIGAGRKPGSAYV